MGAIADAIMAYAKPLIDGTDGSVEKMNKALAISQACWNLALLPEEQRRAGLVDLRDCFQLGDEEFDEFERTILLPMIRRHEQMFPRMHQPGWLAPLEVERLEPDWPPAPAAKSSESTAPQPGRYDPCPCNSGKKYKFCCGRGRR